MATHRANATPVNFERQHSFEAALLDKLLKGNARRGAYLYFSSKTQPSRENGARTKVASMRSAASIMGVVLAETTPYYLAKVERDAASRFVGKLNCSAPICEQPNAVEAVIPGIRIVLRCQHPHDDP